MRAFSRYSGREVLMFFIFVILFLCEAYAATGGVDPSKPEVPFSSPDLSSEDWRFLFAEPSLRFDLCTSCIKGALAKTMTDGGKSLDVDFDDDVRSVLDFEKAFEGGFLDFKKYISERESLAGADRRAAFWVSKEKNPLKNLIMLDFYSRDYYDYCKGKGLATGMNLENGLISLSPGLFFGRKVFFPYKNVMLADKLDLAQEKDRLKKDGGSSTPLWFSNPAISIARCMRSLDVANDFDMSLLLDVLTIMCDLAVGHKEYNQTAKIFVGSLSDLIAASSSSVVAFQAKCRMAAGFLQEEDPLKRLLLKLTTSQYSFPAEKPSSGLQQQVRSLQNQALSSLKELENPSTSSLEKMFSSIQGLESFYKFYLYASGLQNPEEKAKFALEPLYVRVSRLHRPYLPGVEAVDEMYRIFKALVEYVLVQLRMKQYVKDILRDGQVSLSSKHLSEGAFDPKSQMFVDEGVALSPNFFAAYEKWRSNGYPYEKESEIRPAFMGSSPKNTPKNVSPYEDARPQVNSSDAVRSRPFTSMVAPRPAVRSARQTSLQTLAPPSAHAAMPSQPQAYDGHGGVVGAILSREERKAKRRGR